MACLESFAFLLHDAGRILMVRGKEGWGGREGRGKVGSTARGGRGGKRGKRVM
jgi:hypothetical protein